MEAFPIAFLSVLMPGVELLAAPRFKRGRRFDWLYDRMVTTGRLESLLSESFGSCKCGLAPVAYRDRP
jgi:hypothetical protein